MTFKLSILFNNIIHSINYNILVLSFFKILKTLNPISQLNNWFLKFSRILLLYSSLMIKATFKKSKHL